MKLLDFVDAYTCGTGCSALKNGGGSDPTNFAPGQLCTSAQTATGCQSTFATCNSVNNLEAILYSSNNVGPAILINYGTSTITHEFQCGTDGSWYMVGGINGQETTATTLYCDMSCDPKTETCPSTSTLPACPQDPGNPGGCCPVWGPWVDSGSCSDTCGACGVITKTRACLTEGTCPCSSPSTKSVPCNTFPCSFPRKSCCSDMKIKVENKNFTCGPLPADPEDPPSACSNTQNSVLSRIKSVQANQAASKSKTCPSGGSWSSWTSSCSDTCGMCGKITRKRTCLSASSGCPCSGSSTETTQERCGSKVCTFPRTSCCSGATRRSEGYTCGTGCSTLPSGGGSDPSAFAPGQLCISTQTADECQSTIATCNSVNSLEAILTASSVQGNLLVNYGTSTITGEFQCGTDGNWYVVGGIQGSEASATMLFCDMSCDPNTDVCPDTSSLPACPGGPPVTSPPEGTTTAPPGSCCPQWGSWSAPSACSDSCGLYGTQTRTRTCLTAGTCPCSGSSTKTLVCNSSPCRFPRKSCCGDYKIKSVNSVLVCGPLPEDPVDPPSTCTVPGIFPEVDTGSNACPVGGTWSAWASSCSDTCGMCGKMTRTRNCLSASSGCPCSGPTTDATQERCGSTMCRFPRTSCCAGAMRRPVNGVFSCVVS